MPKENKNQTTTEKSTRRKKIIAGAIWGIVLAGAIATGITIPVVQAQKKLPKPLPSLKESDVIFQVTDPNGKVHQIKYDDVSKISSTINKKAHITQEVEKHLANYLYEKEYEASLKYEAIYNANKVGSAIKHFALQSIDSIKDEKKKEIEDLKKRFQNQFGFDKQWEQKFKEEIAKPEWGNATSEQLAIEFKTAEALKANAFRRYQTEINQDFTYKELNDGFILANADIYYTYKGKRVDIAKKGDKIPLPFAIKDENFVLPKAGDPELQIHKEEELKIPLFVTRSFIFEEKNPLKFITEWIKKKQIITSDLTLLAHPNEDRMKPWVVTKEEVIKLLQFSSYQKEDDANKVELEIGINRLAKFKGISPVILAAEINETVVRQAENEKTLVQQVSSNTSNASKYGSQGFKSLKDLISSQQPNEYLPLISSLLGDATGSGKNLFKFEEKNTLFVDLAKELLTQVFKDDISIKTEIETKSDPANNVKLLDDKTYVEDYAKLNNKIKDFITDMDQKDFEKLAGEAFRKIFAKSTAPGKDQYKVSTVIKVNDNFLYVTGTGVTIKNIQELKNEDQIKKIIIRDLGIKAKLEFVHGFNSPVFELDSIFSSLLDKNFQIADLLNKPDFKTYIKEKEFNEYLSVDKKSKFTDKEINEALEYEKLLKDISTFSLIKNKANEIEGWIKGQANGDLNADFDYDGIKSKFSLLPHTDKEMLPYIFNTLYEFLKKIG
ncbi:hypothetical protein JN00_0116 [Metamycoplasma subdolum]|uniref:Membrane protein P80 n=1 Tax=Metamycoplasma subdolum TaxID=92407 RepID=A0A3M0A6C9_9BACT|nr:hypothetical protein [Metamycoplasma subdolum]RMA79069.1 hypothetical protein JN00_0116 [Metamycoplasma subdolum]WPB50592.1 hypothetical protein R9C05_00300 [Metamycoplasma subdolum]